MLTIQETADFLRRRDNFLILSHLRPDGDTIGSGTALCLALRQCGKRAYMLRNPEITKTYEPYAAGLWAPADYAPDTVVSVDIATLHLLPDNARPYGERIDLAIDHHGSFEGFGRYQCVEPGSAAAGEIVYLIASRLTELTPEIALRLYVAVSTDTGCFVYGNTTPRTHEIAGKLLEKVDVAAVNKTLFRTKSRVRLAMESRMVADMALSDEERVVVMSIPLSLRREMQATEADIEELSALPIQVEGVDCGITLRELREGVVKVSVRTAGSRIDASAACGKLGGGGHRGAAGATVEGTLEQVKQTVLQAVAEVTGA